MTQSSLFADSAAAPNLGAGGRLRVCDLAALGAGSRDLMQDFAAMAGKRGIPAIAYVLAGAFLEGLSFSLIVPLLGIIFGAGAPVGKLGRLAAFLFTVSGAQAQSTRLLLLLLLFGALMVLRAITLSRRDIAVTELQIGFVSALRLRLAKQLAATRWEYVTRLRHSRITHLMSADIQRLMVGMYIILRAIAAATMLLAQVLLVFLFAPVLAGAILLLLIGGSIMLGGSMRRAHSQGAFVVDANLSLLNGTTQFLGGLKLAISQNLEASFVEETGQTLRLLAERQLAYIRQQAWGQAVLAALAALIGTALILAGYGWFHVAPSVLVAFALVGTRMVGPAGQVHQGAQQFANILPVHENVRQLERELAGFAADKAAAKSDVAYPDGTIVFANVGYRHAGAVETAGLRHFDLTITPGEFIGVTGVSGAGKTTFADLLAGLYPPQAGKVRAGGKPLQGPVLDAWRNGLSYVSQDAFLFHDTIRRNLAWANAQAGEDEMWQALALAGATDLVRGLDKGLDSIVGERGMLVSGGERQRLALARALLRKPRLLILDEATSALDCAAEREIFASLRAMQSRPIIVLIAHREDNLEICDRVVRIARREAV